MGEIICTYIYSAFIVAKTLFEVCLSLAQLFLDYIENVALAIINAINTTITGIISLVESIVETASFTLELSEGLKGKICANLFRCNAFIEDLVNPDGGFTKSMKFILRKTNSGEYNQGLYDFQTEIYGIIQDFKTFSDTICNSGLTFNFATDAIDTLLTKAKKQINYCYDWLNKKIKYVKRQIQKYIQYVIDLGIFDFLDQFKSFFNCVLTDSAICTSIETVHSYFNDSLAKLHLVPGSNGYNIDPEFEESLTGSLSAASHKARDIELQINQLLIETSNVITENFKAGGFDVFKNIFPGGMSWKDIKKGNIEKLKISKYVGVKMDAIYNAIYPKLQQPTGNSYEIPENPYFGIDYILNDIVIDNEKGKIYYQNEEVKLDPKDITIEEVNEEFDFNMNCENKDMMNKPIIDENGIIRSIMEQAYRLYNNENEKMLKEWETAYNKRIAVKPDNYAVRMN